MAGIQLVTEAARRALEVRDVKNFLKLDDDSDEIYVRTLISAASDWVENHIARSLINRTYRMFLDGITEVDFPLWEGMVDGPDIVWRKRNINLPRGPIQSVTHVKTYDDADNEVVFASSDYYVDSVHQPPRIMLRSGASWPTALRVGNAIEIEYIAGYGSSPAHIPEPIRLAMYQWIAFAYEHRGDFERYPPPNMPESIEMLLRPYRTMSFSTDPFESKVRTM